MKERSLLTSIREQQRGELMQAAPPRLPLVRGVWRFVEHTVDPGFFERSDVCLGIAAETSATDAVRAEFTAAVADEHQLCLLFECCHVGNVRDRDAAAAENADV